MKKNLKRWSPRRLLRSPLRGSLAMTYGLVFLVCLSLTGCGPAWKKKFIRKRADKKPEQVFVYEPKEYQKEPNSEIYKQSFLFWKAWHEELIAKLGNSKSADIRAFEEALKNLAEMKGCLKDEKSAELDAYVKKIEALYKSYRAGDYDIVRSHQARDGLNRMMLKMDKLFRYNKVKEYIKK